MTTGKLVLLTSVSVVGLCVAVACASGGTEPSAAAGSRAVGAAPAEPAADAPKEGTLEWYMKTKVKAGMSAGKLDEVKEALKKLPDWAPEPSWNEGPTGWKAIVATATAPDGNVGKACKGCHETWQKLYKEKYKDRILPK